MPREVSLPPIFSQYQSAVRFIQQKSPTKFVSNCPNCGGEIHQEAGRRGEKPDRCVWFLDKTPLGHCFKCGTTFWPDKSSDWKPPSAEQMIQWKQRQEQLLLERKADAESKLELFRSSRLWEQYREMLNEEARKYWERRGIPRGWQDWLQLGWRTAWKLKGSDGNWYERPSAALPIFDYGFTVSNCKHRIIDPPPGVGKYRYELYGLGAPLYLTDPEQKLGEEIVAVEGEIKAAVTKITLDDVDTCVVGLPGLSPGPKIIKQLQQADRIILITDPGSRKQTWSLCKKLGKEKVKVLIPAQKIDDAIIESKMTKRELRGLLRNAVPAA